MTGRTAWFALLALSVALAINHVVVALVIDDGDTVEVAVLAAANLASVVLLVGPWRHGHVWAWWALWVQVFLTASVLAWGDDTMIKVLYAAITAGLAFVTLSLPRVGTVDGVADGT